MNWIRSLFKKKPLVEVVDYPIEFYKCCDNHTLTRQRIEDLDFPVGDWRWGIATSKLHQYRYWCSCGSELTDGPTGGCAVCAVCEKCKINYGADLPGYWGH